MVYGPGTVKSGPFYLQCRREQAWLIHEEMDTEVENSRENGWIEIYIFFDLAVSGLILQKFQRPAELELE